MHIPDTLKWLRFSLAVAALFLFGVLMSMPISASWLDLARAVVIGVAEIILWIAASKLGSIETILRAGITLSAPSAAQPWRKPGATPSEVLDAAVEHAPDIFAGARAEDAVYRAALARIQAECPHVGIVPGGYCDACQLTLPGAPPAAP